ncbi:MAG TPA: DUF998 domain-containing protein [Acidimicrobiales bacterium]
MTIAGIGGFVAAWSTLGATADGYSPVDDAISRLAATGAPTRTAMTAGLLALAGGVGAFGVSARAWLPGRGWIAALATAGATVAVAAIPLGSPARDTAHGVAASAGYATLAAVPLLTVRPLFRDGHRAAAAASAATGIATAACLVATAFVEQRGLLQRAGLTITHAWIVAATIQRRSGRGRSG